MCKMYFLLTAAFLVCKITFSNGWSISGLHSDSSAEFKRETLNNQNTTTVQEEDIPDNYTCKNGELISALFICDGEINCKDKSDETHELCSGIVCPFSVFRCTYGACIYRYKLCDGKQDCIDGSDEDYPFCSQYRKNISAIFRRKRQNCDFKCGSGDCVSMEQICDGVADCQDGSDETKAQCDNLRCPPFLFRCTYGACIYRYKLCDGKQDCIDGSDEDYPFCSEYRKNISAIFRQKRHNCE
ncbi:lipoprotein receptor [Oryctes borbonicus]|uniref:Lipoprotein receptor n=1 Tax=Oryctes borbonicus TaxID=1629725 RepID=A0A0T6BGE7_9SCAR|nr:lipoprotein receptor [Oryctes borbonicus]